MEFDARSTDSFIRVKYEDLIDGEKTAFGALFIRMSVPIDCMSAQTANTRCQTANPYEGPLHSDTRTVAWRLGYKLSHPNTSSRFLYYNAGARQGALVWIQKGDKSKATLVFPHALFGTPIGLKFK